MNVLHHLGQAAALLLLLELLVFLLIFLGVAGGLAFGLRWVNGKTDVAFEKVNGFLPMVRSYRDRALGYAALPVIKGAGAASTVARTLEAVEARVEEVRARRAAAAATVVQPVPTIGATQVQPLDAGSTQVQPLPGGGMTEQVPLGGPVGARPVEQP